MPSKSTTRLCKQCATPFIVRPTKPTQRFCSAGCGHLHRKSHPDRLWERVDRSGGDDACWPYLRRCDKGGYGVMRRNYRHDRAHRIAYQLTHGPIPPGMCVCHTCDNPPCCNPMHLWLGTHAENVQDRMLKGREARGDRSSYRLHPDSYSRGSARYNARLTEAKVVAMRARYTEAGVLLADLAAEFGCSIPTAHNVVARKSWKHVP